MKECNNKKSNVKIFFFVIFVILFIVLFFVVINIDYNKKGNRALDDNLESRLKRLDELKKELRILEENNKKEKEMEENALHPDPPGSQWSYSKSKNEMTDGDIYFAKVSSANKIELDFPYDGLQKGNLLLRKMNGVNEVIFYVDKGHIVCKQYDKCLARIRIDDEKEKEIYFSFPDGDSRRKIFLENYVFEKIYKAEKILLEITFYNDGIRIFKFPVVGFNNNSFLGK